MKDKINIEELKSKYGSVNELTVPLDAEGEKIATIYLRDIDRKTYSAATKVIQKDELEGTEVILKNLYVGGDNISLVIENFNALRACSVALVKLLTPYDATLKKI
jgi:hypothetical protein